MSSFNVAIEVSNIDFFNYSHVFALSPSGSPLVVPFSSALVQLIEKGVLHLLRNRWWKPRDDGCVEKKLQIGTAQVEPGFQMGTEAMSEEGMVKKS